MKQTILKVSQNYKELDYYLTNNHIQSLLLVCDKSLQNLSINSYFENLKKRTGIKVVKFNDFHPNPLYSSVVEGVQLYRNANCQSIIAVGGGSAMDVAKCIKLYNNMNGNGENGGFLTQTVVSNNTKLLVIPTTAGTGSEATRYAVIYYKGEKQSITHESIIPETVLMDSSVLTTLPLYQKKATMLDALCHSIESFWSINSTEKSKKYSKEAIELVVNNMEGYLLNDDRANEKMLKAAHIAGKAINISQTTAGHAMCYKLTGLYGIAHGHAAALCVRELWPWMIQHIESCTDLRGKKYIKEVFLDLGSIFQCTTDIDAAIKFRQIIAKLKMGMPNVSLHLHDYKILCESVNPIRLKNNPIKLDETTINVLYHKILQDET